MIYALQCKVSDGKPLFRLTEMNSVGFAKPFQLTFDIMRTCTISPKGIVWFRSCNKAVAYVFLHKAEPSSATGTGQDLLD